MTAELRRQVFRTPVQWARGLAVGLQRPDDGGVAILPRATFQDWATQSDAARCIESFALDPCGRIYWVHRHDGRLYRHDPACGRSEPMVPLADPARGGLHVFGRILYANRRLFVLDRTSSRVLALRPDTFQIIAEIELREPVDIAFGAKRLFSLDRDGLHSHDAWGRTLGMAPVTGLAHPIAIGADAEGHVLVLDARRRTLARCSIDLAPAGEVGNLDDVSSAFRPRILVVSPSGGLYLSDGKPVIHEFAPDGAYLGTTGDASTLAAIQGLALDARGRLYASAPAGIARFASDGGIATQAGCFYSATLDHGLQGNEGWHRLDLVAEIAGAATVDVYYASARENESLKSAVDAVLARNEPAEAKRGALETLLGDRWKGPESLRSLAAEDTAALAAGAGRFRKGASHSVLFSSDTGRYLWIKLALSGLAPGARAAVREMRVYYPRLSYLRYLPAVYQEDKLSREFLERYLSTFETFFGGLEATIERIPETFDPELTPPEFLSWLAQWVDLGLEEDWGDTVKRALITNASRLYKRKGTPAGLADFVEIVLLGRRPVIREAFEAEAPFVLGDTGQLGVDTRLRALPLAPLRSDEFSVLGRTSFLGASQLRASTWPPVDPFREAAHRFTLLIDLTPQEFARHRRGLERIVREYVPAHVDCEFRPVSGVGAGPGLIVGLNTRLEDPQPLRLGRSLLGRTVCAGGPWYGPELGISAHCFEGEP